MTNLVNHHADEEALFRHRIGPRAIILQGRARAVKRDHRVFHPAHRSVDRLRSWVRIIKREPVIDVHRVDNGRGGIFLPQLSALFRIEGHRHNRFILSARLFEALSVPSKLSRAGPGKIADVFSFKLPRLRARWVRALIRFGFFRRHNEEGPVSIFCISKARALRRCQHLTVILQDT